MYDIDADAGPASTDRYADASSSRADRYADASAATTCADGCTDAGPTATAAATATASADRYANASAASTDGYADSAAAGIEARRSMSQMVRQESGRH